MTDLGAYLKKPGRGQTTTDFVFPSERAAGRPATVVDRHAGTDGSWRPDTDFTNALGLLVKLEREHGLTSEAVLKVPLRLQTPVIGDLQRDAQTTWQTYQTIQDGQRAVYGGPNLLSLPLQVLLLDRVAQDSASPEVIAWADRPDPQSVLRELRIIAGLDPAFVKKFPPTPFRLTIGQPAIWGGTPIVRNTFTLTRVAPTIQRSTLGEEMVDLTFQQWVSNDIDQMQQPQPTRTYRLKRRDTLYGIATAMYHRASLWKTIARANGISAGVKPNSAPQLAAWAKKHHKTQLKIPPAPPR